ncbi:MAG TPA: SAM-dependent chlorinase/fluorinase [Dehalococcoidia bacterium]|nr:SAM-dependent chlorinase/fluorinase [Dehalococcoidia bacterium]
MSRPLITLTTDFGLGDNYVGAVKGAILSICPDAQVVDITHLVAPQDIEHGVYLTSTAWPYFPDGAIHVAVVDPGVGTDRRPLLLAGPSAVFIGPDNGILSAALPPHTRPVSSGSVRLPEGYRAFVLDNDRYYRAVPSNTFHGRDIFGPVAAQVANGVDVEAIGSNIGEIVVLPLTTAESDGAVVRGKVLHVDTFGNLVSDIPAALASADRLTVDVAGTPVPGLGRTYGEHRELFALITSDGWLAVAQPNGSAAALLGVGRGEPLLVRLG